MIKFETLVLGDLETNCYIVWDEKTKQCLIIDPADDGIAISEEIQAKSLKPIGVLVTHAHFDHIMGALDLKLIYNVPFYCSSKDEFLLTRQSNTASHFLKRKIEIPNFEKIDIDLDKIDSINLGDEVFLVIKTPGHTPGSVCLYNENTKLLFSGDTLFFQLRGRTDFSYGSTKKIYNSLAKLMKLPADTEVYSGHGEMTTIGTEAERYVFRDENYQED